MTLAPTKIDLPGADVLYWPHFFEEEAATTLMNALLGLPFAEYHLKMYGRQIAMPRLIAWLGDPGATYSYSGVTHAPVPWTPEMLVVKRAIEPIAGFVFNSCLAQLYRDGQDSIAPHSDDEPELGPDPVIGSVSFGATRKFRFRDAKTKKIVADVPLSHGSFVLMGKGTQLLYTHEIPKEPKVTEQRINLTFRVIEVGEK